MKSLTIILVLYQFITLSLCSLFCDDFWSLRIKKSINFVKLKELNPFLLSSDRMFNDDSEGEVMSIRKDKVVVLTEGSFHHKVARMDTTITNAQGEDCNTYLLLPEVLVVCQAKLHHFHNSDGKIDMKSYDDAYLPLNIVGRKAPKDGAWTLRIFQEIEHLHQKIIVNFRVKVDFTKQFKLAYKTDEKKFEDPEMKVKRLYFRKANNEVTNDEELALNLNPVFKKLPCGYKKDAKGQIVLYDLFNKSLLKADEGFFNPVVEPLTDAVCELGSGNDYDKYYSESSKEESSSSSSKLPFLIGIVILLIIIAVLFYFLSMKNTVIYKFKANITNSTDINVGKSVMKSPEKAKSCEKATSVKSTIKRESSSSKNDTPSAVKSSVKSTVKSTINSGVKSTVKSSIQKG